jgi:hypothetical protein
MNPNSSVKWDGQPLDEVMNESDTDVEDQESDNRSDGHKYTLEVIESDDTDDSDDCESVVGVEAVEV